MTFNIRQKVFDEYGEYLEDAAMSYQDQLVELFEESPEGRALLDEEAILGWAGMMVEYGINYPGVTPPEMTPRNLEEVLFDIFPRKVSAPPEDSGECIHELRAFWRFLQREFNLKNAAACLKVLDDNAIKKLEEKMADPSNFGMAKSMVMRGSQRGFDMTTQEGMQKWTETYNAGIKAGTELPIPLPGEHTKSAQKVHQKIKRKLAAQSRRKNRKRK